MTTKRYVNVILSALLAATGAPAGAQSAADTPVAEADLRAHIAYLASDALEGRKPGTAGETLAVHYIAQHLYAAGFVGGMPGGGWYQPVPLTELTLGPGVGRIVAADGAAIPLRDAVFRTAHARGTVSDAPLVYVGYGVDAARRVRADVRGKVALMLMASREGDNAATAADRRLALGAAGAAAVILIADPRFAYDATAGSFARPRPMRTDQLPTPQVEGLVTADTGDALLRAGGLDPAAARRDAVADDYAGAELPLRATLSAQATLRQYDSYNVVARLPGRHAGAGTVVLMGHWDHLGRCRPEGAADRICNGAVDNASGIAVMLEVARHVGAGPRLEHDVIAIATTAEEMGLLGADYYADHPTVPLADIRILLNLDTVAIAPRGEAMAIIGRGTPLDAEIIAVARGLGRAIDGDGEADSFLRRQDGWAMAKHGVPAVMAGGSFSDMARLQTFMDGPYHEPGDELTDATPLGGAADDADLHIALVRHFANEGAPRH